MFNQEDLAKIDLDESKLLKENRTVLKTLLKDQTTGENIKWATNDYQQYGEGFEENQEIRLNLIADWYDGFIHPSLNNDSITLLDRQKEVQATLEEMADLNLEDFLASKWLVANCGEGLLMGQRYDREAEKIIDLAQRAGFIDAKFQRLNQEVSDLEKWKELAIKIYQSTYAYDYRGDKLLLARENLLLTLVENYFYQFNKSPENKFIYFISEVISKNVFQMDGATYQVPYSDENQKDKQLDLLDQTKNREEAPQALYATTRLWNQEIEIAFREIIEDSGNGYDMKFDVVIGDPSY